MSAGFPDFLVVQAEQVLGERLVTGSLAHVALFAVILFATPLCDEHTVLTFLLGTTLVSASMLRIALGIFQERFYPARRRIWNQLFDVLLALVAACWGCLCALGVHYYGFTGSCTTMLFLVVSGVVAGATTSLSISRARAFLFIVIVLGIPFTEIISHPDRERVAVDVIFVIYGAFLLVQANIQNREHFQRARIQLELDQQTEKGQTVAKMACLGEMAGSIAHEINNPIAIIDALANRAIKVAKRDARQDDPGVVAILPLLVSIQETVAQTTKIVRGMKSFSRDGSRDPMIPASVSEILDNAIELGQLKFKCSDVTLTVQPFAPAVVECQDMQIVQVLLNLLSNAFAAARPTEGKWVRVAVTSEAQTLRVRVVDSGKGIPPEVQEVMMTPFFSTKESSKGHGGGAGLGLTIAKNIAENHGGRIYYELFEGNTSFVLELPLEGTRKSATELVA